MSMHLLALDLLAQPPDVPVPPPIPAPPDPSTDTAGGVRPAVIPGFVAPILGTIVLVYLLSYLDKVLPGYAKFDDYIRTALIFFGIVGPLTLVPIFNSLSGIVLDVFNVGLAGSGAQIPAIIGYSILNIIGLILAIYVIYREDNRFRSFKALKGLTWRKIIFVFLVTASFFGLPWVNFLMVWTINNVSISAWDAFITVFNYLADRRLSLV